MPKKIFELAKDLDMGSIDLVEQLKQKGFSVKNHMTVLTDEEVEKVMGLYRKSSKSEDAKGKTSVRKVKSTVVKKKATASEGNEGPESATGALGASYDEDKNIETSDIVTETPVRSEVLVETSAPLMDQIDQHEPVLSAGAEKGAETVSASEEILPSHQGENLVQAPSTATVIVQEAQNHEQEIEHDHEPDSDPLKKKPVLRKKADILAAKAQKQEAQLEANSECFEDDRKQLKRSFGLTVVSRPDPKPVVPAVASGGQKQTKTVRINGSEVETRVQGDHSSGQNSSKTSGAKQEAYDPDFPKPHRFTPVYIPPAPSAKVPGETTDREGGAEDDKSDDPNKKRFGGLAAMMSGRAVKGVGKVRDITQMRADEELKSYSTLNSLGRPLYANIGKKKVYSGPSLKTKITETKDNKRYIEIHGNVTIVELAKKLKVKFKSR